MAIQSQSKRRQLNRLTFFLILLLAVAIGYGVRAFYLHIVPRGGKGSESSSPAVVVSRRTLRTTWLDNTHLAVTPDRGTIEFFTNLWVPDREGLPFVEVFLFQNRANDLITPDGHFAM